MLHYINLHDICIHTYNNTVKEQTTITLAPTWWSLDESKTFLKCSSDSINLAPVVTIQVYVLTDINIIIVRLRIWYFSYNNKQTFEFYHRFQYNSHKHIHLSLSLNMHFLQTRNTFKTLLPGLLHINYYLRILLTRRTFPELHHIRPSPSNGLPKKTAEVIFHRSCGLPAIHGFNATHTPQQNFYSN